jgi:hypothetical protein
MEKWYLMVTAIQNKSCGFEELEGEGFGGRDGSVKTNIGGRDAQRRESRHRHKELNQEWWRSIMWLQ